MGKFNDLKNKATDTFDRFVKFGKDKSEAIGDRIFETMSDLELAAHCAQTKAIHVKDDVVDFFRKKSPDAQS